MVKHPRQLGTMTRAALVLLRLAAASEVFRVGYMVGSYRQVGRQKARAVANESAPTTLAARVGCLAGSHHQLGRVWSTDDVHLFARG